MTCYRCGAKFEQDTVFCPECGAAIITDDDKTVAAPFGEKTARAYFNEPTDLSPDATMAADRDELTAVGADTTLIADMDKTVASPELYKKSGKDETKPEKETDVKKPDNNDGKKKNTAIIIIAILAVVIVAVAAVLLLFKSKAGSEEATEPVSGVSAETTAGSTKQEIPENIVVIDVPNLSGKTVEEAEHILNGKGITYEIVETFSDDVEAGKIVSQIPEGGSQVTPNTLVNIMVSIGKEEIATNPGGEQIADEIIPATSVVISPSSLNLLPGQTAKVTIGVLPENADKNFIVTFDDYIVASIDENYNVMAISAGTTTMKVYAPDGTTVLGSIKVTVKEPETQPPVTQAPTKAPVNKDDPKPAPTKAPVPVTTQLQKFKVSFDANGGRVDTASKTVTQNGTYGKLPPATRSGYRFDGWYTTLGAKVTSSSEIAYNYDHTLKAEWTAVVYNVDLDANGGSVYPSSISVNQNGTYEGLPTPTRSGYTFNGWYTIDDTKVTASSKVAYNYDHTLEARWSAITYTITLDANGGSVSPSKITVKYNGTYVSLPTPTRNGYKFAGWEANGTPVTASSKIAYNSNHTLKATWTEKSYTPWSTSVPPSDIPSSNIKTRTVYSYRDKETTTSNSKLSGDWILENTTSSYGDYGSWNDWSKTKPSESANRQIETKTVTDKAAYTEYTYGRWVHSCSCSGKYTALKYCSKGHAGTFETKKTTSQLKMIKDESWGAQYKTSDGQLWYIVDNKSGSNYGGSKKIAAATHTEYRYRDRIIIYTYHYYRWGAWSAWSTTSYSKTSTRDVRTQTQYSYKPN